MAKNNVIELAGRDTIVDPLTDLLRAGAEKLIYQAVEAELQEQLARYSDRRTETGLAGVVRNGFLPARELQTNLGPVTVRIPKIRSKTGEPITFQSVLVPPYIRKTKTLEAALPWLYLKGVSSGEMGEALKVLVGPQAQGLSAEVLLKLKSRGLNPPQLAVGDGAMGFWAALDEIYPKTRQQRCWMHKTMNVLNCLPKSAQPKAKQALHAIWQAETKADADQAFDLFIATYEAKYPKATLCLHKDRDELLVFYDFPAQHWQSIRTSNPIESTFATIRHRTKRSKGCLTRNGMLHMMFKLGQCAEKKWRRLRGFNYLAKVITGVKFKDGIEVTEIDQVAA